jgi:hypothetical protein
MQEAGFSAHNVQVAVLAMEDMLAWMEEGGQVGALFFYLFWTGLTVFLPKKRKSDLQFWRHDGLCGFDWFINVEVQSLSWIATQQWLMPIRSPPPQFSTNKRLKPMFSLLMVQYILALMVKMLTDLPSHHSKMGINGKIIPSCYFLSNDFFLPIFVGWHLWCHQQHKCTSEHASEAGRRKVQGAAIFFFFTFLWSTHVSALASVHTRKLFSW